MIDYYYDDDAVQIAVTYLVQSNYTNHNSELMVNNSNYVRMYNQFYFDLCKKNEKIKLNYTIKNSEKNLL